jgi:flavorubredoxin
MSNAVSEGVKTVSEIEVETRYFISADELSSFDAVLVGTPTYHHDTVTDFKKLFEEAAIKGVNLKGKIGAAFGSYGWSGEAPKMIIEIMKNRFEMNVTEPPLLAKYSPDAGTLQKCREFGKRIAEKLLQS